MNWDAIAGLMHKRATAEPATGLEVARNLGVAAGAGAGLGALTEWLLKDKVTWRGPVAGGVIAPAAVGSLHGPTRAGIANLVGLGPKKSNPAPPVNPDQPTTNREFNKWSATVQQRIAEEREGYKRIAEEYVDTLDVDGMAAERGLSAQRTRHLLVREYTDRLQRADENIKIRAQEESPAKEKSAWPSWLNS